MKVSSAAVSFRLALTNLLPNWLPPFLLLCPICLLTGTGFSATAHDAVDEALALLQAGNVNAAETLLRDAVRKQPPDAEALGLLAVVLDQQSKFEDADPFYRKAIAINPRSSRFHNNYGNHLLKSNQPKQAKLEFQRVLDADPSNVNARTQLARLDVQDKLGAQALARMRDLPAKVRESPDLLLLSMQAHYLAGQRPEADAILARLSDQASHDASGSIAIGSALFGADQYEKAERLFARALDLAPDSFEAAYYCGLAESRSGHNERSRELLQQALRLQPGNLDATYDLAVVQAKAGEYDEALKLLGNASKAGPARPDIQRLLAELTARLGYFEDSAAAWERYLQLTPTDESAQRERAFVQTATAGDAANGLSALKTYVRKHPKDSVGHYELATAENPSNPGAALVELNRAIQLKPELTAARFARGLLLQRDGQTAAALLDFQAAARRSPTDAVILDRLGETEMATDRLAEAVRTLRSAADLAPGNQTILNHLGRVLLKSGNAEEAGPVFARLRLLGPAKPEASYGAGLLQFLGLSPDEQLRRYRNGVERTVRTNPGNVQAQIRYLQLLLEDGDTEQAAVVTRKIASLNPTAAVADEARSLLLSANQIDAANILRTELSGVNK